MSRIERRADDLTTKRLIAVSIQSRRALQHAMETVRATVTASGPQASAAGVEQTEDDVKRIIDALKSQLYRDIKSVNDTLPQPTGPQIQEVRQARRLHDELQNTLNDSAAAVTGVSNPGGTWAAWLDSIKPDLKQFDTLLNTLVSTDMGVCTYPTSSGTETACTTKDQCTGLNGQWQSGGC